VNHNGHELLSLFGGSGQTSPCHSSLPHEALPQQTSRLRTAVTSCPTFFRISGPLFCSPRSDVSVVVGVVAAVDHRHSSRHHEDLAALLFPTRLCCRCGHRRLRRSPPSPRKALIRSSLPRSSGVTPESTKEQKKEQKLNREKQSVALHPALN
jgi:hypothetical protein